MLLKNNNERIVMIVALLPEKAGNNLKGLLRCKSGRMNLRDKVKWCEIRRIES